MKIFNIEVDESKFKYVKDFLQYLAGLNYDALDKNLDTLDFRFVGDFKSLQMNFYSTPDLKEEMYISFRLFINDGYVSLDRQAWTEMNPHCLGKALERAANFIETNNLKLVR